MLTNATTWMNLGDNMLERSQTQKNELRMSPGIWGTQRVSSLRGRENISYQAPAGEGNGALDGTVSAGDAQKFPEMDSADGCTKIWMYLVPLNYALKNGYNSKFYVNGYNSKFYVT